MTEYGEQRTFSSQPPVLNRPGRRSRRPLDAFIGKFRSRQARSVGFFFLLKTGANSSHSVEEPAGRSATIHQQTFDLRVHPNFSKSSQTFSTRKSLSGSRRCDQCETCSSASEPAICVNSPSGEPGRVLNLRVTATRQMPNYRDPLIIENSSLSLRVRAFRFSYSKS